MNKTVLVREVVEASKTNTANCGELLAIVELLALKKSKKFEKVEWYGGSSFHKQKCDIVLDGKLRIEVKTCNRDNVWAKTQKLKDSTFDSGFDRVDPSKFHYVICVSLNNELKKTRFFIFDSKEAQEFENTRWKNAQGMKVVEIKKHKNDELNRIIQNSDGAWDKIK